MRCQTGANSEKISSFQILKQHVQRPCGGSKHGRYHWKAQKIEGKPFCRFREGDGSRQGKHMPSSHITLVRVSMAPTARSEAFLCEWWLVTTLFLGLGLKYCQYNYDADDCHLPKRAAERLWRGCAVKRSLWLQCGGGVERARAVAAEQAGGPCDHPGNALKGDGRLGQGTGLMALVETGRRGLLEIKIQGAKETTMDRIQGWRREGCPEGDLDLWLAPPHVQDPHTDSVTSTGNMRTGHAFCPVRGDSLSLAQEQGCWSVWHCDPNLTQGLEQSTFIPAPELHGFCHTSPTLGYNSSRL